MKRLTKAGPFNVIAVPESIAGKTERCVSFGLINLHREIIYTQEPS